MKTGSTLRGVWWAAAALMFVAYLSAYLSAADAVIKGVVTDQAGKPIRYAHVRASIGPKSISRFTGPDGRYEITVPAGSYDMMAEAFGFGPKRATKDAAQAGEVNFSLAPRPDVLRLTSAEAKYLLPDDEDGRMVQGCFDCHGSQTVLQKRGWRAAEWEEYLPRMTTVRWGNFGGGYDGPAAGERTKRISKALEKVFGPDAPVFGPDSEPPDLSKVKRTEPSPDVLRATIKEYNLPSPGMMPHSITVDSETGTVWLSSYDALTNSAARFDPKAEKFEEFVLPVKGSLPHTGSIMKDGSFIVALARNGVAAKLARVDRAGKVTTYDYPEKTEWGAHTSAINPAGDTVWISTNKADEIWAFDVKTEKFRTYTIPKGGNYDIAADSKGVVWISQLGPGNLIRLDPKTGETTVFKTQEMVSVRGLAVDAQDRIWWADFRGHKLGMLDQKTGAIKLWQAPTANASPYGVTPDMERGYIWYADTHGNFITRFDPKTEKFIEYPLPTRNGSVRFAGVDPQGRAWYGGFWNGKLGVIDPEGGKSPAVQSASR